MNSSPPCPVPEEQRPINEYRSLVDSWFFGWATVGSIAYLRPIVLLWLASWVITAPVSAASFTPAKHPVQFFLVAAVAAGLLPILAMLRLYLGWSYIHHRLLNATVAYEESGWYDGQLWQKPPEIQSQDRLIAVYEVQPILRRLQITLGTIALLCLLGTLSAIGWNRS
jgi:hypothetical protein